MTLGRPLARAPDPDIESAERDGLSVLSPSPAAIWMPGINPSACVQVAPVETWSAGSAGRGTSKRLPAAVWIGRINPSVSVQAALVVILAALPGFTRAPRPTDRQPAPDPAYTDDH